MLDQLREPQIEPWRTRKLVKLVADRYSTKPLPTLSPYLDALNGVVAQGENPSAGLPDP